MMKIVYVIPILAAVLGLVITTTMQQSAYAHTLAWRFGNENGQQSGREVMDADPCSTDTNASYVVHFHGHLIISYP
jgi:hypothetical protein